MNQKKREELIKKIEFETDIEQLREYAVHKELSIRLAVAKNEYSDSVALHTLLEEKNIQERNEEKARRVESNHKRAFEYFKADFQIKKEVAKHHNLSVDTFVKLVTEPHYTVRKHLANNPLKFKSDNTIYKENDFPRYLIMLQKLTDDRNASVTSALAKNIYINELEYQEIDSIKKIRERLGNKKKKILRYTETILVRVPIEHYEIVKLKADLSHMRLAEYIRDIIFENKRKVKVENNDFKKIRRRELFYIRTCFNNMNQITNSLSRFENQFRKLKVLDKNTEDNKLIQEFELFDTVKSIHSIEILLTKFVEEKHNRWIRESKAERKFIPKSRKKLSGKKKPITIKITREQLESLKKSGENLSDNARLKIEKDNSYIIKFSDDVIDIYTRELHYLKNISDRINRLAKNIHIHKHELSSIKDSLKLKEISQRLYKMDIDFTPKSSLKRLANIVNGLYIQRHKRLNGLEDSV